MEKVIFIHILKCGGTSLRYMLLHQHGYDRIAPVPIGEANTNVQYPVLRGVHPLDYQMTLTPEEVANYTVVMSHYDWQITERLPDHKIITMLRHPVHQLHSLFAFMQRYPQLKAMHPEIQGLSFREWLGSEFVTPYLNTQTRYLSGHGCESLDTTLGNLQSERLTFGLVERFDESVALFNRVFGWSLKSRWENFGGGSHISTPVFAVAENLQADDMILYRQAQVLFERQFDVIQN